MDSDRLAPQRKKADVAEHPKAFHHVGLLFNEPPGMAELPFIQSSGYSMFNYTPRNWLNTPPGSYNLPL